MSAVKQWSAFLLVASLFALASCASTRRDWKAARTARGRAFEDVFPATSFTLGATSLDEAYDYVRLARAKFAQAVSNKRRVSARLASLSGPAIQKAPVTLLCAIDLGDDMSAAAGRRQADGIIARLERAETAVFSVYVFAGERAVCLSDFYRAHTSASSASGAQEKEFTVEGSRYTPSYPRKWNIEKAFAYLRGEAVEEMP